MHVLVQLQNSNWFPKKQANVNLTLTSIKKTLGV